MSAAEVQSEAGRALISDPDQSVMESSRRRLWALGAFKPTANALASEPAYKSVESACKDALASWPNAKAAILYGSRTRGDHRADSDWDIAFITSEEGSLPDSVISIINELSDRSEIDAQAQAISQARFHRNADALGSIAAPIAREGRLIAGHCEWPETERDPVLKAHEYKFLRNRALRHIASASESLAEAIDCKCKSFEQFALGRFVEHSADGAEHAAKIAFGKLASAKAYSIPRRRQVDRIVEVLDRILEHDSGPSGAFWNSGRSKRFRELLGNMKGHGDKVRERWYPPETVGTDVVIRAANRLVATVSFAVLEVETLPDPCGLRQAAMEPAIVNWDSILAAARGLRRSLQNSKSNNSASMRTDSVPSESASAAIGFGEEIAQALEQLADSLYAEMGSESRAKVNPDIYVVGFGSDGKPTAIADDAEAIMDRADKISNSPNPRMGAGLELLDFAGFDQALSTLGFALEPTPLKLVESKAMELVRNRKVFGPDETALREVLAELLREREDTNSSKNVKP